MIGLVSLFLLPQAQLILETACQFHAANFGIYLCSTVDIDIISPFSKIRSGVVMQGTGTESL